MAAPSIAPLGRAHRQGPVVRVHEAEERPGHGDRLGPDELSVVPGVDVGQPARASSRTIPAIPGFPRQPPFIPLPGELDARLGVALLRGHRVDVSRLRDDPGRVHLPLSHQEHADRLGA